MSYKNVYMRVVPVGAALAPIGILFGVLAAQENWGVFEVLLMSILGFTASGQFTYLGFVNQGIESIGYLTAFIIILSINLRYIPMSLSASNHIKTNPLNKSLLAHWLADESYAVETKEDNLKAKVIIRLTIVVFWSLSTATGVLLANIIPDAINRTLIGLTFPASTILILLSISNIATFRKTQPTKNSLLMLGLALGTSVLLILVLGAKYFWIPSIAVAYYLLKHKRRVQ